MAHVRHRSGPQRQRMLFCSAMALWIMPAAAAPAGTPNSQGADERRLRQIESQWNEAIVKRDTRALEMILSDEFSLIWADGSILSKKQLIEGAQNRKAEIDPFVTQDVSVRILENVAILTGRFTQTVRLGEKSETNSFRYTDIYRRTGGQWRAISAQATLIRAKPAQ